MSKTSIIIPARNENLIQRMVKDVYDKALGEIEVIVTFDGPPYYSLPNYPNLSIIYNKESLGMRECMNIMAQKATGKYLLKADAHCTFGIGFDETLKKDCDYDWIVVPRLYSLDYEEFKPYYDTFVDYYYLSCPWTHPKFFQMQSCFWDTKTAIPNDNKIDEIMTFQGSFWFMHVDYWRNFLHGVAPSSVFGPYAEHQEMGLKAWLSGGKCVVNKNIWYAHEHRSNKRRGWHRAISEFHHSHISVAHYFVENHFPNKIHNFDWLIEKFWPLPTKETITRGEVYYWPTDWRKFINGES